MWQPGDVIVHQEVWKGRVWAARPLVVLDDQPDLLLLWLPKGTVRKVPWTPPSRPDPGDRTARVVDLLDAGDWVHVDHVWDVSSLWIVRPGDWHAVWASWLESGDQLGWYVNLQRPFRRTALGIEAMDLMLDVVADPDGAWVWKDDDEFQQILDRGIFDADLGRRVREEAWEVIGRLERRAWPFDEAWAEQRPLPAGPPPELAPGWEEVPRS